MVRSIFFGLLVCALVVPVSANPPRLASSNRFVSRDAVIEAVQMLERSALAQNSFVQLGGYLWTNDETLQIMALTADDGINPITGVDVRFGGVEVLELPEIDSNLYFLESPIDSPAPGSILLELSPDNPGPETPIWPYFTVEPGGPLFPGLAGVPIVDDYFERPVILLAGHLTPRYPMMLGQEINLLALVYDEAITADTPLEQLPVVEVHYGGRGRTIFMDPVPSGVIPIPETPTFRWYAAKITTAFNPLGPGDYVIELVATDIDGHRSTMWPYLSFGVQTTPTPGPSPVPTETPTPAGTPTPTPIFPDTILEDFEDSLAQEFTAGTPPTSWRVAEKPGGGLALEFSGNEAGEQTIFVGPEAIEDYAIDFNLTVLVADPEWEFVLLSRWDGNRRRGNWVGFDGMDFLRGADDGSASVPIFIQQNLNPDEGETYHISATTLPAPGYGIMVRLAGTSQVLLDGEFTPLLATSPGRLGFRGRDGQVLVDDIELRYRATTPTPLPTATATPTSTPFPAPEMACMVPALQDIAEVQTAQMTNYDLCVSLVTGTTRRPHGSYVPFLTDLVSGTVNSGGVTLDPDLADGLKCGYTFNMSVGAFNNGSFFSWSVGAWPVNYGPGATQSFYIDDTGVVRAGDIGGWPGSSRMPVLDTVELPDLIATNEGRAVGWLKTIISGQDVHYRERGGFSLSLSGLNFTEGSVSFETVDGWIVASGERDGYRFSVTATGFSAGNQHIWSAAAWPVSYRQSGRRSFVASDDGSIFGADRFGAGSSILLDPQIQAADIQAVYPRFEESHNEVRQLFGNLYLAQEDYSQTTGNYTDSLDSLENQGVLDPVVRQELQAMGYTDPHLEVRNLGGPDEGWGGVSVPLQFEGPGTLAMFVDETGIVRAENREKGLYRDPMLGNFSTIPQSGYAGTTSTETCQNTLDVNAAFLLGTPSSTVRMMDTEVTRSMWQDLRSRQPLLPVDPSDTTVSPTLNHPVNNVTWHEAILFANLASIEQGLTPKYRTNGNVIDVTNYVTTDVRIFTGEGYLLPSEYHWELACRGGKSGQFGCNERNLTFSECHRQTCDPTVLPTLSEFAWFCATSATGTAAPVAQKRLNLYGLFDMHGNVAEWCFNAVDDHARSRYQNGYSGTPSTSSLRGVRGGSFASTANEVRCNYRRDAQLAGDRAITTGFRLMLAD